MVSANFHRHIYLYYSIFIALLLRVILEFLPPMALSSGAYHTVSDDRVSQVVPDLLNPSKTDVVRYSCGLPQTVFWPGSLGDSIPSLAKLLDA